MAYKEAKKWRGVIKIRGKRYQQMFDSKREAREWETNERKRLLSKIRTVYLSEAATKYLDCVQKMSSAKTYSEKRKVLWELAHKTGDISIDDIRPETLQDFIYSKNTPSNCNRARKNLHAFFAYCQKFLGLSQNPVSPIERLPHERRPQPVPTEEEFVRLLMAAERHDRNLIIACVTTGGRRSEIFRWTWTDDINFEKRTVRLGTRKSRSRGMRYREVHMNEMLCEALQGQWKTRLPQSDYVFQNRDARHPRYGDRFTERKKFMRGLCKRAGVKHFGFHGLRRFFASLLADKYKEGLPVIQKLLGHASPSTTDRYVFNVSADARRALEKISFETKVPEEVPQKEKRS